MNKAFFAIAVLCLSACTTPATQRTRVSEFPAGAATPSAAELQQRLAGNHFVVNYAGGGSSQLQFKRDGYVFINASNNYSDNGEWKTEDGKLCFRLQKQGSICGEARVSAEALLLQRANGEIVRYEPR